MADFLFEYGLFTAKMLTFILLLLIGTIIFMAMLAKRKQEMDSIQIEKMNEKFDALRDSMEAKILSKEELKQLKKERKKQEKEKEKEDNRRLKSAGASEEPPRNRIFVLRFIGDIHASEVDNIREAISAILLASKPEDEVLVLLESPGGLVHNYGLAASQLQRIRARGIKLTAAVDLIAASGGYLMASVAHKIIAAPFAVLGSIGVLAQLPNFNRFLDKHNIDIEQHTAGEYKTTLTMFGKNSEKDRKKFQEELEDTHVLFKQYVTEHRPQLDIDKLATGEHWYGERALRLNLIDEILTSDDYLLQKSKHCDIYEVSYHIEETLSDKLTNFFENLTKKSRKILANILSKHLEI